MFGKNILFFSLLLVACAQPKYESTLNSIHSNTNPGTFTSAVFPKTKYELYWTWENDPIETNPGSIIFRVFNKSPLDHFPMLVELPEVPSLTLFMPSMGHGSAPTTVAPVLNQVGTYRATNVVFIMPGDWELRFQLKEGGVVHDEAVVSLQR